MIDYVKEYGVTDLDFEYIMNNLNRDIIDNMILSEPNVREVLSYYNKIGIKENVAKIIVTRPDLILISQKKLEELLSNIDLEILKNMIEKDIEDLIILGI